MLSRLKGDLAAAALALWALWACVPAFAQDLLAIPAATARVIDSSGTLNAAQIAALEAKLAAFEAQAGPQMVVLLVRTTAPEDIASYAQRVGDAWKLGRKDVGDGVLLLVAKDDRRVWIATAKALEGAIPDLASRQIIRDHISPAFKQGDYAGGLNAAVDALIARIKAEKLPGVAARKPIEAFWGGSQLEQLALFFFVAVPVISMLLTGIFGRRLGSLLTSGASGGIAWMLTGSTGLAIAAGVVSLVVVGVLGVGALLQRAGQSMPSSRGRSDPLGRGSGPVIWGGGTGGWGGGNGGSGGSGGGGFSSGGGGDFGGGGAGGDW